MIVNTFFRSDTYDFHTIFVGCYRHLADDYRLSERGITDTFAARDVRACERACDDAEFFTCRAFAFSAPAGGGRADRSCLMTDVDPRRLSFGGADEAGLVVMDYDYKVYERMARCYNGGGGNTDPDVFRPRPPYREQTCKFFP